MAYRQTSRIVDRQSRDRNCLKERMPLKSPASVSIVRQKPHPAITGVEDEGSHPPAIFDQRQGKQAHGNTRPTPQQNGNRAKCRQI
jgi:hypothetical protein